VRRHRRCVRVQLAARRLSFLIYSTVSGAHTRTIQIATPTVGGLMKFAVKTVTCLGCKTPLRSNNSVKSELQQISPLTPSHQPLLCRWCCMQQLPTKDRGVISQAGRKRVRIPSTVLAVVDAMSTLSGVFAPGKVRFTAVSTITHTAIDRMYYVRAKTARSSICGRRPKRT
jgi:hypothetical protein